MGDDIARLSRDEIDSIVATVSHRLKPDNIATVAATEALLYLTSAVRGDVEPHRDRITAAKTALDFVLAMQKHQRKQ